MLPNAHVQPPLDGAKRGRAVPYGDMEPDGQVAKRARGAHDAGDGVGVYTHLSGPQLRLADAGDNSAAAAAGHGGSLMTSMDARASWQHPSHVVTVPPLVLPQDTSAVPQVDPSAQHTAWMQHALAPPVWQHPHEWSSSAMPPVAMTDPRMMEWYGMHAPAPAPPSYWPGQADAGAGYGMPQPYMMPMHAWAGRMVGGPPPGVQIPGMQMMYSSSLPTSDRLSAGVMEPVHNATRVGADVPPLDVPQGFKAPRKSSSPSTSTAAGSTARHGGSSGSSASSADRRKMSFATLVKTSDDVGAGTNVVTVTQPRVRLPPLPEHLKNARLIATATSAGLGLITTEDGTRVRGKMELNERRRVDDFLELVMSGQRVVRMGDLAKELREYVNPVRPLEFFEKLVSRRKLNTTLRPYLMRRWEPMRTADHYSASSAAAPLSSPSGPALAKGGAADAATADVTAAMGTVGVAGAECGSGDEDVDELEAHEPSPGHADTVKSGPSAVLSIAHSA